MLPPLHHLLLQRAVAGVRRGAVAVVLRVAAALHQKDEAAHLLKLAVEAAADRRQRLRSRPRNLQTAFTWSPADIEASQSR